MSCLQLSTKYSYICIELISIMLNRIKQIIEKEKLSSTQFATEIGVQRSALSHVLSGRNKPSLDFMMKIKKRYPEINLDWLLLGKGRMTGVREEKAAVKKKEHVQVAEELPFRTKKDEMDEIKVNEVISLKEEESRKTAAVEEKDTTKKIIVLYRDNTYETFEPRT